MNPSTHNAQRTVSRKGQHPGKNARCSMCPDLCASRRKIVGGELHFTSPTDHPQVMVVAEAPGVEEDRTGRPLIGISGEEARHHLDINGISSFGVWLTNVVMCRPENNRDPSAEEIRNCVTNHLIPLILRLQPKWIISMGRVSTQVIQDINEGKYAL